MPQAKAQIDIRATPRAVFDLIHDYERRLEWDPFLREARLLHDSPRADLGVQARCSARWALGGWAMETDYVSFNPPRVAAVRMTRGPLFLHSFAASLRQEPVDDDKTRVSYQYRFTSRPRALAFLLDPLLNRVFLRETTQRLGALKAFLEDAQ